MAIGILFAVLQSSLLAVANLFLKKSYKNFPPSVSFFIFSLFSLFAWGGLGLILGVNFSNPFLGLLIGFVSAIFGQALYIYVLSKGELSITASILSSYSVYTVLFSIGFLRERPSVITLLFIGLAMLGTLIVTFPEKGKLNKKDLQHLSMIAWAVFGAIAIGAADTATKYYIDSVSVGSFLFYTAIAQVVVSFVYLRLEKESLGQFRTLFTRLDEYKNALLGSFFVSISTVFLFLAFSYTLASIIAPIGATNPVLTVILAVVFLKEKLSLKNIIGLILVIAAILGLAFFLN